MVKTLFKHNVIKTVNETRLYHIESAVFIQIQDQRAFTNMEESITARLTWPEYASGVSMTNYISIKWNIIQATLRVKYPTGVMEICKLNQHIFVWTVIEGFSILQFSIQTIGIAIEKVIHCIKVISKQSDHVSLQVVRWEGFPAATLLNTIYTPHHPSKNSGSWSATSFWIKL